MSFGNIILRASQLALTLILLGLTASLIKGQTYGGAPAATVLALFCSVVRLPLPSLPLTRQPKLIPQQWSFLIALLGLVAIFAALLPARLALALDALASLLLAISGTVLAAALGAPHSCASPNTSPNTYVTGNAVINGGRILRFGNWVVNLYEPFEARCRMGQATTALLWIAAAAFAGSAVVDWALVRRAGERRRVEEMEMRKGIGGFEEGRSWL